MSDLDRPIEKEDLAQATSAVKARLKALESNLCTEIRRAIIEGLAAYTAICIGIVIVAKLLAT
jgi:hypothetical protein